MAAFTLHESKTWEDNHLIYEDRASHDHWTQTVKAWERITIGNTVVYGPLFLLGMLSLSDFAHPASSRLIEHWVSNLMFPIYLYSAYLLYDEEIVILLGWIVTNTILIYG